MAKETPDEMTDVNVTYKFKLSDGVERVHAVKIDPRTLDLIEPKFEKIPDWALLENGKCHHCPLSADKHKYCPLVKNLSQISDEYKDHKSYEVIDVEVETAYRSYKKTVSMQEGLYSIFGLIMATSGCPHMGFLKAMARFHLPFSNLHETMVRSTAIYLLRQYFVAKRGGKPDFELKDLETLYNNVQGVNTGIIERIRSVASGDADANSVTILWGFAQLLSMQLSDGLSEIEPYFSS